MNMRLSRGGLDALLCPEIRLFGQRRPAFHACGLLGLMLASLLTVALAGEAKLSLVVLAELLVTACVTFLVVAMITKVASGEERLTYYHHEIAILAAATLLLHIQQQPLLPYLDITILGIGMFLVAGRLGCLMVGCCHGRPWRWGVRYGQVHAERGFAPYLTEVRLFPVQAVESAVVLAIVVTGAVLMLRGWPPGTVLGWYSIAYGAARFLLEFLRGDADRPYWLGFSGNQWISGVLMAGALFAEVAGKLPLYWWHGAVVATLWTSMPILALRRRLDRDKRFQLLQPRHLKEIALAMRISERPSRGLTHVRVAGTSLGILVSGGRIGNADADMVHYAVSSHAERLSRRTAATLARLIVQLTPHSGPPQFVEGSRGVMHILVAPTPAAEALRR
jgi:prolipoprotein diacylglyceryltransferase